MSADEFWNGDPILAIDYRRADRMNRKRDNEKLWLQGAYIYDALCAAHPLFQPFAKKGTKPNPYTEEPYPIDKKDRMEAEERKAKKQQAELKAQMERFATEFNKRFENKE